tara:strand:- start:76 stop:396 length:321 start_codon:yes stop_codon:yes gene_type:complete
MAKEESLICKLLSTTVEVQGDNKPCSEVTNSEGIHTLHRTGNKLLHLWAVKDTSTVGSIEIRKRNVPLQQPWALREAHQIPEGEIPYSQAYLGPYDINAIRSAVFA